jgi:hypothetical protein
MTKLANKIRAVLLLAAGLLVSTTTSCGERVPAHVLMRVDAELDASDAWSVSPRAGAWPADQPLVQASRWEGERLLLAVTRNRGGEYERVEILLPGHGDVAPAEVEVKWYEDSKAPEFAQAVQGVVRVNAGSVLAPGAPLVVEYELEGRRSRSEQRFRGKMIVTFEDLTATPVSAGRAK